MRVSERRARIEREIPSEIRSAGQAEEGRTPGTTPTGNACPRDNVPSGKVNCRAGKENERSMRSGKSGEVKLPCRVEENNR
ncbi:hypothetical protein NDU88_003479 [Pleurodeles waltl]|uniref:Uncharacterized protein n=1 Tax=Pleurodeles waltl TaxID=8319 RepID=A0AAV7UGA4_PLEWA|nr:hypothetical protein NDU88_003479 [Pleurodeles waltl]